MHWVEVDGTKLPKRIGGHPALDFCNTWAGWGDPGDDPRREWLPDYDRFALWAGFAELVGPEDVARLRRDADRRTPEGEQVLADARRLRTHLHAASLDPSDEDALVGVSTYVREAGRLAELKPGDDGRPRWSFRGDAGLSLPLLAVARAAAELLTGPELAHVRACPGDGCGWLFLDRRGRRRWCSMSSCGNRAKVRAHAERHR